MIAALALCVLLAAAPFTASGYPQQPQNPVIGIITTPLSDIGPPPPGVKANAGVEAYYVNWLQSYGIRVIPFPWNASIARQRYLAKRVNGVLYPGGGLGGSALREYVSRVESILNMTVEWNRNGDPFFIWGTCQGFQVLCAAAARNVSVIQGVYHGMYPRMMSLNFTQYQPRSKLFGLHTTPGRVLKALQDHNTTMNWHHECVTPQGFEENPPLRRFFQPLSTNVDPDGGAEFISSMESPSANVFATQFHPERPPFEFSNDLISHTPETLSVSHYLAKFVSERLKLNNHTFDTPQQAETMNVEQFPIQNSGWGSMTYWVMDNNDSPSE